MKTNIVDHTKTVFGMNESKTKLKWTALLLFLVFVAIGAGGCDDYYSAYPGYGPYYGGYGPYGAGYGRGYYAAYPGSVTVEVGDRPYYSRGPGYYVGHTYYVWRPGHWELRHGQRVWIHGHYVVR
jgi:WXXGXW repeat (2 copies)